MVYDSSGASTNAITWWIIVGRVGLYLSPLKVGRPQKLPLKMNPVPQFALVSVPQAPVVSVPQFAFFCGGLVGLGFPVGEMGMRCGNVLGAFLPLQFHVLVVRDVVSWSEIAGEQHSTEWFTEALQGLRTGCVRGTGCERGIGCAGVLRPPPVCIPRLISDHRPASSHRHATIPTATTDHPTGYRRL